MTTAESKVWSISKENLLPVLDILDLVPSRPGVSASEFIRATVKKSVLTMELTSEICGKVSVKGSGEWPFGDKPFYFDRRLLMPFLQVAKKIKSDAVFEFSKDKEGHLCIQNGRRRAQFEIVPEVKTGYGQLDDSKTKEVKLGPELKSLMSAAVLCASPDPATPELNCVFVDVGEKATAVLSYNQIVMFCGTSKEKERPSESVAFPLFLIPYLSHSKLKTVKWSKKEVILYFDCGAIWQTTSAIASKKFPVNELIELIRKGTSLPKVFKVESSKFSTIVNRLVIYLGPVRRQDWVLDIHKPVDKEVMNFDVRIPQGGFKERLKASWCVDSAIKESWPLDVIFPVLEYLSKSKGDELKVLYKDKSPYYLVSKNFVVVVSRKDKRKK
jgi:hypothetical protein